uniref:Uncharacterized protein n=1 Tax=Tetranychus urticae TaxID=32264 RepID=T1K8L7_TETUR
MMKKRTGTGIEINEENIMRGPK